MTSLRYPVRSTLLASMAALALSVAPGAAHAQAPSEPAAHAAPAAAKADAKAPKADAQAPKVGAPKAPSPPTGPLAPLAWLQGCWQGQVNKREFREYWMPLQGDTMVGIGQSTLEGKMNDYEYLRLESRDGSTVFSQFSGKRAEVSFKLATTTTDAKDTIFTFANTAGAFPARLIYRRGGLDGWLYETIEGPLNGANKSVIYPLRRVDCETGEFILK